MMDLQGPIKSKFAGARGGDEKFKFGDKIFQTGVYPPNLEAFKAKQRVK